MDNEIERVWKIGEIGYTYYNVENEVIIDRIQTTKFEDRVEILYGNGVTLCKGSVLLTKEEMIEHKVKPIVIQIQALHDRINKIKND